MAATRSVTVRLRSGVKRAILPDNRSMVEGTEYDVSYDDFLKISAEAKTSVIEVVSINTDARSREGIDLTTNTTTLPEYTVGLSTFSRKLGQTTPGFAGEVFKLVKLVDAVNASAGSVATFASKTASTVTVDRVGGSSTGEFAGVFVAAVTAGRYGWIQVAGTAPAVVASADVAAGDALRVSPSVDGSADGIYQDESQVITLTGFSGTDSFKLTFGGDETIAFVRGTNATAADIQAGLEDLDSVGEGNVSVSGTTDSGPFTVEFIGDLANANTGAIAVTSAVGCTGAVSTTDGGLLAGDTFGVALSARSAGKVEAEIRGNGRFRATFPGKDLFTQN